MATKQDKYKNRPGQLFTFAPDSYLDRTSRPVYAVVYLLAFIVLYEFGTFLINPEVLNQSLSQQENVVVSFIWLQNLLGCFGFSQRMTWFAVPVAVIVILLAIQITCRSKWSVNVRDFVPTTIECVILAVPLIVFGILINHAPREDDYAAATQNKICVMQSTVDGQTYSDTPQVQKKPDLFVNVVTGIGAGIYEELIFRLILISLLMLLLQDFLLISKSSSVILAVLISAALFSAHHHITFVDGYFIVPEAFNFTRFTFRTIAGIYFAVVFAVRGFAVAAGTHIFYDIIAAMLNAFLLS